MPVCGRPHRSHPYQRHEGAIGLAPANVHNYIIGATRSGKTNYILDTIEEPFCFIDKHGNAARELADGFPCLYWRPADLSFPVGFNPLENVHPDLRWKVTAEIVSVFSDIGHFRRPSI